MEINRFGRIMNRLYNCYLYDLQKEMSFTGELLDTRQTTDDTFLASYVYQHGEIIIDKHTFHISLHDKETKGKFLNVFGMKDIEDLLFEDLLLDLRPTTDVKTLKDIRWHINADEEHWEEIIHDKMMLYVHFFFGIVEKTNAQ